MTITTAQYKAAIEAKIAAANGSTALKDLTLLKTNADLWLLNNPSGSIAGYATLEGLIQTIQNSLGVGSSNIDLSLAGVASFPQKQPESYSGFKNRVQITTSQSWVVPAGVYKIALNGIGGGGAGMGTNFGSGTVAGGAGGGASAQARVALDVIPGDVLSIVIGAAGTGVVNSGGNEGGATTVALGTLPVLSCAGGSGATGPSPTGVRTTATLGGIEVRGGVGGGGKNAGAGAADPGTRATIATTTTTLFSASIPSLTPAAGGLAGSEIGPGGGGGSSAYGPGGVGGNGSSTMTPNAGQNAPATSYGAGGGGSSGTGGTQLAGGNGGSGLVEIYY